MASPPAASSPRSYVTPEVAVYGSIEEVTKTKTICNSNDIFGVFIDIIIGDDGTDIDWSCLS